MGREISVQDLKAEDFVKDFSETLGIDYDESPNEFCTRLPDTLGTGYIRSFQFDHGMGVVEMDFLLKKEVLLKVKKGRLQPLKFLFNRESSIFHQFQDQQEFYEIRHLENVIVSGTLKNGINLKLPANKPICVFSLEINRKLFEQKIEQFHPEMNDILVELFRDVNGIQQFYYKSYFSLEISKFIEEFIECDHSGFMKQVYQEGKAYEILTHQLKQYIDDLNEPDKRIILRKATIDSIEKAVSIIKEEIERTESIVDIAKRVGLNQNTLQNGFQQLYKTSVNQFIRNHRIEKAKELLETSDLNITEITYKVGINSRSYFSKLFKKQYGVNPKKYLDQVRNKKDTSKSA